MLEGERLRSVLPTAEPRLDLADAAAEPAIIAY